MCKPSCHFEHQVCIQYTDAEYSAAYNPIMDNENLVNTVKSPDIG